jgi:hypothetical protein
LRAEKVKVYPAPFRQKGAKTGQKVARRFFLPRGGKGRGGQVAQKKMWFLYGYIWEYVRFILANKQDGCYHHDRRDSAGLRSPYKRDTSVQQLGTKF